MRLRSTLAVSSFVALLATGVLGTPVWSQQLSEAAPRLARVELDPVETPAPAELRPPSAASNEPAAAPVLVPSLTPPAEAVKAEELPPVEPLTTPASVIAPEAAPSTTTATISADPIAAEVRQRLVKVGPGLTKDERQALLQIYAGDGAKPLWVADKALTSRGAALVAELGKADDWGLQAKDFDIPGPLAADVTSEQLGETELRLSLAALKYARFARGGRVDPTQLSTYLDRKAQLLPAKRILEELRTAAEPDAYLRGLHPQHPQFEKLRRAYLALRDAPPATDVIDAAPAAKGAKSATLPERGSVRKLLANMEMWRWMPADLGNMYLMVNVPEFQFRLVRQGEVIHTERVVTGKPETQTPIFSDMMETVVFKPTWNVPDSIKVKELLPALARNPAALARQGLKVSYKGQEVDPTTIDWATTDIRALHVFQPPSGDNALGIVKFLFPNKHAVYLHDTPSKALFNSSRRTFSHGCIRVRNPVRLAEVLMEIDRNWSPVQVKAQLAPGAADNNNTALSKKFPVHIAYFTAWANDAGEMQYFPDVYAYETNIHLGLEGKSHLIVKKKEENLGAIHAANIGPVIEQKQASSPASREWMKKVFQSY